MLSGYQGNCLNAPAEVSTWTKFCEIDLPKATSKFLLVPSRLDEPEIPLELAQFEVHLGQPVKIHNIRKRMQEDQFMSENSSQDPIYEYARTQHLYAEGPDFLLSDVLLYPHFYLMLQTAFTQEAFKELLPRSFAWYLRVSETSLQSCVNEIREMTAEKNYVKLKWPKVQVPNQSLYKSDPKRLNPSARIFTRQPDIERAMEAVSEAGIEVRI